MYGSQTPAHYPSYGVPHDPVYRKMMLDLRPPSRLPWVLLVLVMAAATYGAQFAWKERDHLLSLVRKGEQSEKERGELATRLMALESERSALVSARDSLKKTVQARTGQLADLQVTHDSLQGRFSDELVKGQVTLNQSGDQLRVALADRILFEPGRVRLSKRGQSLLERLGQVLSQVPDREMQVSGHTDNHALPRKLRARYANNRELSVARALNVVQFLQDRAGLPPERLVASGYGEHRPIDSNRSSGGRARNRRIEVLVTQPTDTPGLAAAKR
jgi:chemotaxis protein MotB